MSNDQVILKGIGASSGQVRGKIQIVTNNFKLSDFKSGSILVATITDPSMVAIMSKAAAIITDIGGLTSHPAIVSREMGIPCIVATKQATTKLKNGDNVLVDGATGKVYPASFKIKKQKKVSTTPKTRQIKTMPKTGRQAAQDQDYKDLIKAYQKAFSTMDFTTFDAETGIAVSFHQIDPIFAKPWIKRLETIITKAQKKFSDTDLSRYMQTPSTIRSFLIFDSFMAKLAGLPLKRRQTVMNFYLKILKAWCLKDPFCLNGNNVIHSPQTVAQKVSLTSKATPTIAKSLGKLIHTCYHAGYTLFGDMNPQLVYENYGPYYIKKNGKKFLVVIKEFSNLKPTKLWPETKSLPFEKITITAVYEGVTFSMDAVTHTNYQGDVINGLKYAAMEIDGQVVDFKKIKPTTESIENLIKKIWTKVGGMSSPDYRTLYLHQKAYAYKPLCEALNLDWKPTTEMIKLVRTQPLKQWPRFKTAQELNKLLLKIVDPRTNFHG